MSSLIECDDDDDKPTFSSETLAALQEFYKEEEMRNSQHAEGEHCAVMPSENWQLSQFWYDDATSKSLAEEAMRVAGSMGRIACVSCPSIFIKLKEINPEQAGNGVCLEFDRRFASVFGTSFVFYDYNEPLQLPEEYHNSCDLVILDPPFLSQECLEKCSQTAKFLAKNKIILCTGSVMEELAFDLMQVKKLEFVPMHSNNLSNEFSCYANYETVI